LETFVAPGKGTAFFLQKLLLQRLSETDHPCSALCLRVCLSLHVIGAAAFLVNEWSTDVKLKGYSF
jgi:hypothetical protein